MRRRCAGSFEWGNPAARLARRYRAALRRYTADVIARRGVLDEDVHFLSKPFTRSDLARKVREVIDLEKGAWSSKEPALRR